MEEQLQTSPQADAEQGKYVYCIIKTDPPRDFGLRILREIAGLRVAQSRSGLVIDEVARGSRSESIGLASGDVIVGVNGVETRTIDELNQELMRSAERSSIVLSIARGRYIYSLTFPMGT